MLTMGKILAEMLDINVSDGILVKDDQTKLPVLNFSAKKSSKPQTMTDCVQYLCKANDIEQDLAGIRFGFKDIVVNDELSNSKVRCIAQELALAIDNNSVVKIKELKYKYGKDKEFVVAKDFLNRKCKEIWNVFNAKHTELKLPYEAMKSLGITNQPTLEFILGDSVRYYEKDGGDSTARIIALVLENKNLSYTSEDIHKFLKTLHEKEKCNYNLKTVSYLIDKQNYDEYKLAELGVCRNDIRKSFGTLTVRSISKYFVRNFKLKIVKTAKAFNYSLSACCNR